MSKFNQYFLMQGNDAADFVKEKLHFFDEYAQLTVKEIGDGNLNYVFLVKDQKSGKSVIVKQAGETLRISSEMHISVDRNRIESEILLLQNRFAPNLVPVVYLYDTVMCACIMEDLSDYQLMRYALMEYKTFPRFAEDITTYLVDALFATTDVTTEHKEKKEHVKQFINPELCEITEDLVFTEPYHDNKGRNLVFAPNADFVKKELYDDKLLHLEAAKLKFSFMEHAQALIHGDLHTGSIFVKQGSTKIFDPEFAFYGPIGYDIGNVAANLIFAWNRGRTEGEEAFCGWAEETIMAVINLFRQKYNQYYREHAADCMADAEGFREHYYNGIMMDTAGFAGTELIRRTVGMAQVKDITTISDEQKRAEAERINILLAKDLIMNRIHFQHGSDYISALYRAAIAVC